MTRPRVDVVIPTRDRPQLVVRAVRSALRQTLPPLEVLVIQDGEDSMTSQALRAIADPRLRVHVAPRGGGPGAVRNVGVSRAQAEWIAFLDDDDEMLPDRLARQLDAAQAMNVACPVVACRCIVRTGTGDAVLPEILPASGEHISEYMFVRKGILGQGGGFGTGVLFARKALLEAVPFPALPRHEDWSWVLKAATLPGVDWTIVPEPLGIIYVDGTRPSASTTNIDWRYSFDWARDHRGLMTARAYVSFLMATVARIARQQTAYGAIPKLLAEALRSGRPRLLDCAIFTAMWTMPLVSYRLVRFIRNRRQQYGKFRGLDCVP